MKNLEELKKLTKAEEDIMRVIWNANKGAVSITEILETLRETKRKDYARTTLITILSKIIEKGYVETSRNGKNAYVYVKVSLEEYRKFVMRDMVERLFHGDVGAAESVLREI